MKSMFLTIFLELFFAVGFGILGMAAWATWRSSEASGWPTVPGTLRDCQIVEKRGSKGGRTYEVKVSYDYRVGFTPYTGNRLAFGYSASDGRASHEQILQRLQHAKTVDVRYDPRDPATSTLSFGMHRSLYLLWAFGLTWTMFVAGFAVIAWLSQRPDEILLRNLITH